MDEGIQSWDKQKSHQTADFHLDPNKVGPDPAEKRIEDVGAIDALRDLVNQLESDPKNKEEVIRQIKFTLNHLDGPTHH